MRRFAFAFTAVFWSLLVEGCAHRTVRSTQPPTGLELYTRHARFIQAKISPKGSYLAVVSTEDGRRKLVFMDLKQRKIASVLRPDTGSMVGGFWWVNDERVVIQLIEEGGSIAAPHYTGEIYAVDATGRGGRVLFGGRETVQDVTTARAGAHSREAAWGWVLGKLPHDPKHILIEAHEYHQSERQTTRIEKLNVYSGATLHVINTPMPQSHVILDENGEPRIAVGGDEDLKSHYFFREPKGAWRELDATRGLAANASPLGFSGKERLLYVNGPGPKGWLAKSVNVDTGLSTVLGEGTFAEPHFALRDYSNGKALVIASEPDLPNYVFIDETHPATKVLKGLLAAFPDEHVEIVSQTEDQRQFVAYVYSDRNPGKFLLVDGATMSAEPLVDERPWIQPEQMFEQIAFHIEANDGVRIHGYVTLPGPTAARPPPLVVLTHGGPHGVRDNWGFDAEAQMLAHEGFAVLQVNYRGSGGYGPAFEKAGHRKWGERVVQDVLDATHWAIDKGYADSRRICAYGGSFGAYASLQMATMEPNLFRCVVGNAGIYDLTLMGSRGDISESYWGRAYLRKVLGEDTAALERMSPALHADKIKAAVFLIHGDKDVRAPIVHAKRMKEALEQVGRPPKWLVERDEAHGFYDEGARLKMYTELVGFLKKHTALRSTGK